MKVFWNFGVIASITFTAGVLSLAQVSSTSRTRLKNTARHDRADLVKFENAPDEVIHGYNLSVLYQCSHASVVHVEVLAYGKAIFRTGWTCQTPMAEPRTHSALLRFPDALLYKPDYFIRHPLDTSEVMLRAWIEPLETPEGDEAPLHGKGLYHRAPASTSRLLPTVPPSQRPFKKHNKCPSWGAELVWQLTSWSQDRMCTVESDMVDLIKFPLASTSELFGVIHKFYPFMNKELEHIRLGAIAQPRATFSVWFYLLNGCESEKCGIIYHVDSNSTFETPLILLTGKGHIVVQVRMASGVDQAFKTYSFLGLRTWHHLECIMEGSKIEMVITTIGIPRVRRYIFRFDREIEFNDTDGYFVIGGDKNMPGIRGYYGPVRYHRLRSKEVENPRFPGKTAMQLDEMHKTFEETEMAVVRFLQALVENDKGSRVCHSLYSDMKIKFGRHTCHSEPWSQRAQQFYRPLLEVLQTSGPKLLYQFSGMEVSKGVLNLGDQVFELVLRRLRKGDPRDFAEMSALIPLLKLSCCLGHPRAAYLLSVIYLAGLGTPTDTLQGHVYGLIAAQRDDRLALMHLGYKHMQGIDHFPLDYDMAYSYYANVAKQTCADRWKMQTTKQYPIERVHLSDEVALASQMDHKDDVFRFMQFQADRGDLNSQKSLARILFWGQRGMSKDIGTAVKLFAKIAMKSNDPLSMYDYSIILFKGQGVKKNRTLALKLMEKAASMGLQEAVNGMGWYYSTFMADADTAVKYFEKAAKNGSKDAVFNLGLYYLDGKYPGKPGKNKTAAFLHFYKAAILGHYDAAVMTAWYYVAGTLPGVQRDTQKAVRLLKRVSEQNGYLGYVVRSGLRAYRRGSRQEAFLSYSVAAETGFGLGQNNVAHLCEELGPSGPSTQCEWRYHNHSTYNDLPHYKGFLRMGDYHYHGLGGAARDIKMAASMYSRAGLAGSAQGIYNLAVLLEEGHKVPDKLLEWFNISSKHQMDKDEVLEGLYLRCRRKERNLDISPCSLALFRIQLKKSMEDLLPPPTAVLIGICDWHSVNGGCGEQCTAEILKHCPRSPSPEGSFHYP
ncbi:hypothetical protein GJAV_G00071950 [Gymnothorax javanicus]|nr:hypothetical protein GJAV_G00071950 [Gymnothorax javanicus]